MKQTKKTKKREKPVGGADGTNKRSQVDQWSSIVAGNGVAGVVG
jgi:hypothetical protein